MTKRSKYDELHDQYQQFLGKKPGTRYERLAALVFKALDERSVVLHDFKLVGDSKVKHQIDVQIESEGKIRKTLVECKDLGEDQDPVGLGVVRNFHSVMVDTSPDQAIIVSTIGFTDEAKQFADHYGIKLKTLSAVPEDSFRQYSLDIRLSEYVPQVTFRFTNEEANQRHIAILTRGGATKRGDEETEIYIRKGDERLKICDFVQQQTHEQYTEIKRYGKVTIDAADYTLEDEVDHLPLEYIELWIDETVVSANFASGIAELVLEGGGEKAIGWDHDLKRIIDKKTKEVR